MARISWLVFVALSALAWPTPAAASSGRLKVLTYNIAGLPDGFMTAHPSRNMPLIGPLLGRYDLALIQEDFAYGSELRQRVPLPYQSPAFVRAGQWNFGDGLSQFSVLPFTELRREPWQTCHGVIDSYFDCLTPKGFTFSRQRLNVELEIDVYNVHLDAGPSAADQRAREAQIEQLIAAIALRSTGRPLLLAGDTNIRAQQSGLLARLTQATGLRDVCQAVRCPDTRRIDRVFVRSTPAFTWKPRNWRIDARFVDGAGQPLSDHLAVAVELDWSTLDGPS